MASASSSQRLTTRGGSCGTLVMGSFFSLVPTFSNPLMFQSPISNAGLDFGFSNSPKIPPNCPKFVQSSILIQKSPNCPKFSQSTKKSPNFFAKVHFQSPKIIQPERYCAGSAQLLLFQTIIAYYLSLQTVESFKITFHLCKTTGLVDIWSISKLSLGSLTTYLFGLTNFPKSNFLQFWEIGQIWIFQFTKANLYLVNYNGGNWKIQKSPNCLKFSQLPKNLPITQKSPNFQSNRQSLISEVQKLSNLEGTLPQDWLKLEHYSSLSLGSLTPRRNDGMNSREYWLFQESVYRASSSQK